MKQFDKNIKDVLILVKLVEDALAQALVKKPKPNVDTLKLISNSLLIIKKRVDTISSSINLTYREKREELSIISTKLLSFVRMIKSFYGVYYWDNGSTKWLIKDRSKSYISFYELLFANMKKLDSWFHSFLEISASISVNDYKQKFARYLLIKSHNDNNQAREIAWIKQILTWFLRILWSNLPTINKQLGL